MKAVDSEALDASSHFDLTELVTYVGISLDGGDNRLNERMAQLALNIYCKNILNMSVHVEMDSGVPGLSKLPSLITSSHKRADVNVYSSSAKTKLLLQVEVQSSPLRQAVTKAIHGAADMVRLLRHSDTYIASFTVFAFPKIGCAGCVAKITVTWLSLHFTYRIEWLTQVNDAWTEIGKAIMENTQRNSTLPHTDDVNPNMMMILSPRDLLAFGENARQLECVHHVMVECNDKIHKLVTNDESRALLVFCMKALIQQHRGNRHFIVPTLSTEWKYVFSYTKVPLGPLSVDMAAQCLRTLVQKVYDALQDLHAFGYSHNDIRLPNVCFDKAHKAVLIDIDRCENLQECPPSLSAKFELVSCMYRRPETMAPAEFTGEKMDYIQLGWLIVGVLTHPEKYHEMTWNNLSDEITTDTFVSRLVREGVYSRDALEESAIVTDKTGFAALFE